LQWLDGIEDLGRDTHLAAGIGERRAGRDRNDLDEVWPRRERRHCVLGNHCRTLRAQRDRECESIELRRGIRRDGERSRGVGRQRDHFCRRFADGQRHRTKRNAIAAFGKAERFCHEKPEGGNLQDNVRFPLALNERYLCRAHRTLAGLQADHAESAATTNEAIEMRDVEPFRGKAFGNLDGLSIAVVSINQASLFKFIQISEIWPKCA
jgi:hypothetical protein